MTETPNYAQRCGLLLKQRREHLGLSASEAARRISEVDGRMVARQSLQAYERGQRAYTVEMLDRIAQAYECQARDLIPNDVTSEGGFTDLAVRVFLDPNTDLDEVEAALVRVAEEVAGGGRIVAMSAPFLPNEGE